MRDPRLGEIVLRDVTEEDLEILFEHQRDPEATRMAAFSPRDHVAFMAHWRNKVLADPAAKKKAIVVDGQVVGHVVSWDHDGKRLVGYWIAKAHWGRGVASGALAEFLAHETSRPIHAYVAVGNVASIRVLEKCGFHAAGDVVKGPDGVDDRVMLLQTPAATR